MQNVQRYSCGVRCVQSDHRKVNCWKAVNHCRSQLGGKVAVAADQPHCERTVSFLKSKYSANYVLSCKNLAVLHKETRSNKAASWVLALRIAVASDDSANAACISH